MEIIILDILLWIMVTKLYKTNRSNYIVQRLIVIPLTSSDVSFDWFDWDAVKTSHLYEPASISVTFSRRRVCPAGSGTSETILKSCAISDTLEEEISNVKKVSSMLFIVLLYRTVLSSVILLQ